MEPEYIKGFLPNSNIFYNILSTLDWVQRENCPRAEYWDTTLGEAYTYGSGRGIRTYEPNEPSAYVQEIRLMLEDRLGFFFQGCFLNKYDTAKDHLGWHADDDPVIDHSKPICVITLGSPREINWKQQGSKGIESINRLVLEPGSLFIMPPGMQQTHFHRIPKAGHHVGPRISLTFRALHDSTNIHSRLSTG